MSYLQYRIFLSSKDQKGKGSKEKEENSKGEPGKEEAAEGNGSSNGNSESEAPEEKPQPLQLAKPNWYYCTTDFFYL